MINNSYSECPDELLLEGETLPIPGALLRQWYDVWYPAADGTRTGTALASVHHAQLNYLASIVCARSTRGLSYATPSRKQCSLPDVTWGHSQLGAACANGDAAAARSVCCVGLVAGALRDVAQLHSVTAKLIGATQAKTRSIA
jgi:hypothetical protein